MPDRNYRKPNSLFDAYDPKEMACKAETIGVTKAGLGSLNTFLLAVLAGSFIAFGACLYTTAITGSSASFGTTRLIGGLSFSLGLILVVVSGAELFTGNALIVIAAMSKKVTLLRLLRNWMIVYFGNLIGSLIIVVLVYYSLQWKMSDMGVGLTAINIAGNKLKLTFFTAFCSGILCNFLVCLAIWLCYSAHTTTDKILSIIFPITAFVALGFEHSIANMYFIPYGILLAHTPDFTSEFMAGNMISGYHQGLFTSQNFLLNNLLPVTLGNIAGGSLLVGFIYWLVYIRCDLQTAPADTNQKKSE